MLPLTETLIRASFINATRSERGNVLLPADLDRTRRIEALRENVRGFARAIRDGV